MHEPTGRSLHGRRVLLTGATGFIGGHVAKLLTDYGASVCGLARGDAPTTTLSTEIDWVKADLSNAEATDRAVAAARPDLIVHLASLVKGARDPDLILPMFTANTASTLHLLDAARRRGVKRVVLAGSMEEPAAGEASTSPYALAKAAAHLYGDYYAAATEVEVVTAQIFMVYGPATVDETKLVPYVITSLLDGETPLVGSGTRPIDWVYVGDVAEGLARCCAVEQPPKAAVPLGTGTTATVGEVVAQLAELVDARLSPAFGAVADRADETIRVADVALTERQLGWCPTVGLRDGLAATIEWYRRRRDEQVA